MINRHKLHILVEVEPCSYNNIDLRAKLRKKYKNILRNIWNPFDKGYAQILGCNTVNRLYITPIGDVLVCPYVHIKIGNVYEQSLKDISEYGFSIKYFHDHSNLCLAGEDHEFVSKCMQHDGQTIFNPIHANELFYFSLIKFVLLYVEDFEKIFLYKLHRYQNIFLLQILQLKIILQILFLL